MKLKGKYLENVKNIMTCLQNNVKGGWESVMKIKQMIMLFNVLLALSTGATWWNSFLGKLIEFHSKNDFTVHLIAKKDNGCQSR